MTLDSLEKKHGAECPIYIDDDMADGGESEVAGVSFRDAETEDETLYGEDPLPNRIHLKL